MTEQSTTRPRTGYAPANGLKMYYESHGSGGVPLVLLHGAYSTIATDFGQVLPTLARTRRVIGVEQQAHGHTADIDRPLSYEQMADDTAALLRHLGIARADLFGYSFGGAAALQVAVRHPALVRKLVLAGGTCYSPSGTYPELWAMMEDFKPEFLLGTPWHEAYMQVAPNPDDFPTLVEKKIALDRSWKGWPPEMLQAVTAPALLMIGDSDIVRPEHTAEMFRLFGGGVVGDLAGLPASRLAVLPGTTHVTIMHRAEWLLSMITEFLDAPTPEA